MASRFSIRPPATAATPALSGASLEPRTRAASGAATTASPSDAFAPPTRKPTAELMLGAAAAPDMPAVVSEANPDADPLRHLNHLSSDALKGRRGPSAEYDAASFYTVDFLKKYGAIGMNPSDARSPYFQTFQAYRWDPGLSFGIKSAPQPGKRLFEGGFYLEPRMKADTLQAINDRLREAGRLPKSAPALGPEQLRQLATATGPVQNIIGKFEGTGPRKDQAIVLMAHLDHVGVNSSGQICNGADDNASGSSALLALLPKLAELQAQGKLDRSVVVMFTAAEELGLVGSRYFVDHPLPGVTLEQIDGVINVDMVARMGDSHISVIDVDKSGKPNYLHDLVPLANEMMGENKFQYVNHDANKYIRQQDGWTFLTKGEDAMMVFEGFSNPTGGGQMHRDYHTPSDDPDKIMKDNGGRKLFKVRDFVTNLAQLASNYTRPTPPAEAPPTAPV